MQLPSERVQIRRGRRQAGVTQQLAHGRYGNAGLLVAAGRFVAQIREMPVGKACCRAGRFPGSSNVRHAVSERISEHVGLGRKRLSGRVQPTHLEDREQPLGDRHQAITPRFGLFGPNDDIALHQVHVSPLQRQDLARPTGRLEHRHNHIVQVRRGRREQPGFFVLALEPLMTARLGLEADLDQVFMTEWRVLDQPMAERQIPELP